MVSNRQHTLIWTSSYDRGLDTLLFLWPDIIEAYPDAQLHVCYGWDLFDKFSANNPERMKWKEGVMQLMQQKGITHHGRIGKEELNKLRDISGIWAYPTHFEEINCMAALEAQDRGVVPVTMNKFALKETVGSGIKVDGDIKDPEVLERYKNVLLKLMGDKKRWKEESKKAKRFAKEFYSKEIAKKWVEYFEIPIKNPEVSVITVTIRTGFWNIMAKNLSEQTYPIKEWIIVDDFKQSREETAKKYAEKYGLNIKYIWGDKARGDYKRKYGLVRANNTGWKASTGELCVFVQDFILLPKDGIEALVGLYRHHPNALLAPTDVYFHSKKPNKENMEDWWDGDTDVLTEFSWMNVRNEHIGIRRTDNPFDFEMNYGAIPRKILERLNGWWEFFDNGLGFDNTEIADRALKLGYYILIDDTNVAACINLWPHIGGTKENIENREHNLAIPYWLWLKDQMRKGKIPVIRDESIDVRLDMGFEAPKEIPAQEAHTWIEENAEKIALSWEDA